jgi:hypothetical protein
MPVLLLIAIFAVAPWTGDDWLTFHGASWRIINGQSLYGSPITTNYYSNPPWLALVLIPVAILPAHVGWALLCAATLLATLALLRHWAAQPGHVKPALALTSPAMLYLLLHGQIVALTKPQAVLALALGTPRRRWPLALAIMVGALTLTVLLEGWWPLALLRQPTPFADAGHNLWRGLWPFQVPLGMYLVVKGWRAPTIRASYSLAHRFCHPTRL